MISKTSIEDIRFTKNQQWRIAYYALILMFGIRFISANYNLLFDWGNIGLDILIGAIAIFAMLIIHKSEKDIIERYRKRIKEIRDLLTH